MDTPTDRSPSSLSISSWDFSPLSSAPSSASSAPASPHFSFSHSKHDSDAEDDLELEAGSSTDSVLTEEAHRQEPDLVPEEADEQIDELGADFEEHGESQEQEEQEEEEDEPHYDNPRDATPIDVQEEVPAPRLPTPPPPHQDFYFSDGTVILKASQRHDLSDPI